MQRQCHRERRPLRIDSDTYQVRCVCGANGKPDADGPTTGGSIFYVCEDSGVPLGYVGL